MHHETSLDALRFDDDGNLWTVSAHEDVTRLKCKRVEKVGLRIDTGGLCSWISSDYEDSWFVLWLDEEMRICGGIDWRITVVFLWALR